MIASRYEVDEALFVVDDFLVEYIPEPTLRLYLVNRLVVYAVIHETAIDSSMVDWAFDPKNDALDMFEQSINSEFAGDRRAAYRAFKLWLGRIKRDSSDYVPPDHFEQLVD